jgi:hypothetical protein
MHLLLTLLSIFFVLVILRLTLNDTRRMSDDILDKAIQELEYNFRRRLVRELNTLHAQTNKQFTDSERANNYTAILQGEIDTLHLWSAHVEDALKDPGYSHEAKHVLRLVWLEYLQSYPAISNRHRRYIELRNSRLNNLRAAQEDVMAAFRAFGYDARSDHDYALERLRLQGQG